MTMELKGSYSSGTSYNVGDVVLYTDNVVYHLHHPAPAGTPPHDTRYWARLGDTLEDVVRFVMNGVGIAESGASSDVSNLIVANLTTATAGKILDATQGKKLQDEKLAKTDVVNNLETTADGKALDARQGAALKTEIAGFFPDAKTLVLYSSTASSEKKFAITVDDDGELTATEIIPPQDEPEI